jgi:hypothetical protein
MERLTYAEKKRSTSPQFLVVETVDLLLDEDPNTDIEMNDHSDGEESDEQN